MSLTPDYLFNFNQHCHQDLSVKLNEAHKDARNLKDSLLDAVAQTDTTRTILTSEDQDVNALLEKIDYLSTSW